MHRSTHWRLKFNLAAFTTAGRMLILHPLRRFITILRLKICLLGFSFITSIESGTEFFYSEVEFAQ